MIKMMAIYKKPVNKDEFDSYYFNTHLPLASKMPGLRRVEIDKIYGTPFGETNYYMIANMYFDSKEDLNSALSSPEGRACGKDLKNFTTDNVELVFSQVDSNN